jgi:flagellum-specific peptidoglycan hydrolase FlgJ
MGAPFALPREILDAARREREDQALSAWAKPVDSMISQGMGALKTVAGGVAERLTPFAQALAEGGLKAPTMDDLSTPTNDAAMTAFTTWKQTQQPPATPSGTPAAMPSAAPRTVDATITDGRTTPPSAGGQWRETPVTRPMGPIVEGDPQGFFESARPYAEAAEREFGIPAALSLAIAANETGYGQRRYMAGDNNYHGIQDTTGTGTPYVDWRPGPNGEKIPYEARQAGFESPLEGFRGFARFLVENPRYAPALERYRQTGDVNQLAADIHRAGYAEDPEYTTKITSIMRGIPVKTGVGEVEAGAGVSPQSRIPAPEQAAGGSPYSAGSYTPNQIDAATAEGLDYETALAVCGPAAAIAFARRYGRNPTMAEAVNLAKQVGWTPEQGMAGPASQQRLLQSMGVPARLVEGAPNWQAVAADVQRGNPVTISTPGHYFVAERYDPESGMFDFGESARVLKASGGRRWFRPEELVSLGMGEARAVLFIDNPESPTPSIAADPRQSAMNAGPGSVPRGPAPSPAPAVASVLPGGGGSTLMMRADTGMPTDDALPGGGDRDPRRFIPERNIVPLAPAMTGRDWLDDEQYETGRGLRGTGVDPMDPSLPNANPSPVRPYSPPGRNQAVPGSVVEYTEDPPAQPYGPFDPHERNRPVRGDLPIDGVPYRPDRYPNIMGSLPPSVRERWVAQFGREPTAEEAQELMGVLM